MHRTGLIVVVLAALNGGWMMFDGARALVTGDYIMPSSGEYAGQLGPWADVVGAVGLDPRSTTVKVAFVVYGGALVLVAVAFSMRAPCARRSQLVVAALGLWYLPFGTILNLAVIVLLLLPLRT